MSDGHVVGHVNWSPDFKSTPPNKIEELLNSGAMRLEPCWRNGKLISVDLVSGPPPDASRFEPVSDDAAEIAAELRPHQGDEEGNPYGRNYQSCGLLLLGQGTPSPRVEFTYTNWKGETKRRRAVVSSLWWGANTWHKVPQLLVNGYDLDKKAPRTYAAKDITDLKLLPED